MVVYADDIHLRWILRSMNQALDVLANLQHVLMTLQAFGFSINMQKICFLLRLQGKEGPSFMRRWIQNDLARTTMAAASRVKTAYLGVIVSYRAWDVDTILRRIAASSMVLRNLRPWLVNDVHLIWTSLKLYKQWVLATVQYGIHEMGLTQRGFRKLINIINTHHRMIAHSPVLSYTWIHCPFLWMHSGSLLHGSPSSFTRDGFNKPCQHDGNATVSKPWIALHQMFMPLSQIFG